MPRSGEIPRLANPAFLANHEPQHAYADSGVSRDAQVVELYRVNAPWWFETNATIAAYRVA
jgi:hypothetical protein